MSSWFKRKATAFEQFTIDVIFGRRSGVGAALFAAFLQMLSWLFNGIVQLRYWLYRNRILHDQPLGCLVVVVGNLTVGGTGKTPVVEKFARALRDRGRRVAILSRGYRSKAPPIWKKWWYWLSHTSEPPPRIVSDGQRVLLDSEKAGDEPYMLARNLPGVLVLVDKNRVKAGAYAIKKFGCDTLILDDGFQYLPLKGRLNLLLVDKTNPFGNGHLLPRGILREPIKHLKRASYVFLTKSNGQRDPELEDLINTHNPNAEIIECAHRPQYLQRLGSDERQPLSWLRDRRVGAFSGIAVPESFEKFLRDLGAHIEFTRRFLDHYRFNSEDFVSIFVEALDRKVGCIITTEKDAVRIPEDLPCAVPIYYLRLEIDIIRGATDFDEAVGRICFPKNEGPSFGTRSPLSQTSQTTS
ncbi:tetraacyldisaccharide 4'-kinase [Opitutaceae bacterium TAV4]|uniref:tetraacyldisaccharide 4'-kinase n=1 Tax=Geminisphaera colitermitum TaxID=1148786 RepID=UPI000158C9F5|nr:tetraacyldisaccharide 4'-kinase [Geminisphaera colitermitum]RRJ96343.1 tetraacyldisaccharide 4'-kinase [Opitutaceae bacterium TAV4]RRK00485.1 tetraacyldisaccharide 4'-kinase [Opitutaceae bacterium TAV3]